MPTLHELEAEASPESPARCPRRLLDAQGPRCSALVLVRDGLEHEAWHDRLDELLQQALEHVAPAYGFPVAAWPQHDEPTEAGGL